MHENLERREKIKGSSDRTFGLVIAAGFALVALSPLLRASHQPRWWALAISIVFVAFAFLWPTQLALLNKLWMRLGLALSAVASPIVLGLLFYTTLLPIGMLIRLSGRTRFDCGRNPPLAAIGSHGIRRMPRPPR